MNWPEGKENIRRKTSTWMTPSWGQNHGLFRACCHSVTAEFISPEIHSQVPDICCLGEGEGQGLYKLQRQFSKELWREPKQPGEWELLGNSHVTHTWDPQVRQTVLSECARVSA